MEKPKSALYQILTVILLLIALMIVIKTIEFGIEKAFTIEMTEEEFVQTCLQLDEYGFPFMYYNPDCKEVQFEYCKKETDLHKLNYCYTMMAAMYENESYCNNVPRPTLFWCMASATLNESYCDDYPTSMERESCREDIASLKRHEKVQ